MENINKVYTGASYRVNTSTAYHYKKNSLNNENCIMTDDIVNLDDDNDEDAIEEAEKLLDQLDLLSSSESWGFIGDSFWFILSEKPSDLVEKVE